MITYTHNDTVISLIQDAHIADDGRHYIALATDQNDGLYQVSWYVIDYDNSNAIDDESDMCDWDVYTIKVLN